MKTKDLFVILSLFIILMCCISAISAASDDIMDNAVSEIESGDETISNINDEQAIDVDSNNLASYAEEKHEEINDNEELSASEDNTILEKETNGISENEELSASEDNTILEKEQTEEKLSTITSSYDLYSINLDEAYIISPYSQGTIDGTISPPASYLPEYSFKLYVYDLNNNVVHVSNSFVGRSTYFSYVIPAKTLLPGMYDIYAINDWDDKIMAESVLGVEGNAVITANNFNGKYMSNTKMTAMITDRVTGRPLTSLAVQVVFTKGKTKKTKIYYPDSNGKISFTPPVGVGTWKVTFSSYVHGISGSTVKKATMKKSAVSIKAYKVTEYKGFKTTLKVLVKSHGKKVNEGKVTFRINGKTYTAKVKKGIATVKIKLTKLKTYQYTARFNGNANLAKSKTVKSKATLKKRVKTKIIFKNQAIYAGDSRTVTILVKTDKGKKVANGKLKIVGAGQTQYVTVKNGKAKMTVKGLGMKHYVGFTKSGETYKKSIVQNFKVYYVPTSHKYISSKKNVKVTSRFKCLCGKTSTHTHTAWSGSYYYKHIISVK